MAGLLVGRLTAVGLGQQVKQWRRLGCAFILSISKPSSTFFSAVLVAAIGGRGTVFVINVCHSIFDPLPAPGYHPEGTPHPNIGSKGERIVKWRTRRIYKNIRPSCRKGRAPIDLFMNGPEK
jgi:hypothetical protein